jgi:hypothetical protein
MAEMAEKCIRTYRLKRMGLERRQRRVPPLPPAGYDLRASVGPEVRPTYSATAVARLGQGRGAEVKHIPREWGFAESGVREKRADIAL